MRRVRINAARKAGCQNSVARWAGDLADIAISRVIFTHPDITAAPIRAATDGHPHLKIRRAHYVGWLKYNRGIHRTAGDVVAG